MEKRLRVELGKRSYDLLIGAGLLKRSGEILLKYGFSGKALVVTNPKVGGLYASDLIGALKKAGFETVLVTIPDGEEYKTLSQVERIYEAAAALKMERESLLIALGGGVIGDTAGFAAATYLRGVRFIQVPTTLLAQVDSSLGGKVAVNRPEGKNLVGSFYQPSLVLSDLLTLDTLEEREYRAGMAEALKAGLIGKTGLFRYLVDRAPEIKERRTASLAEVIYQACQIKLRVVEEDEFEGGLREILNYGHTIGHALEVETGYREYRHGEAVAVGIVGAAILSEKAGCATSQVREETIHLLRLYGLPEKIQSALKGESLWSRMTLDKKVKEGRVRFVLPIEVGQVVVREDLPKELILETLHLLGADRGGRE